MSQNQGRLLPALLLSGAAIFGLDWLPLLLKRPQAATLMAALPGLMFYLLAVLAAAGLAGLAAMILRRRRIELWSQLGGPGLLMIGLALTWAADRAGGLPLLGQNRLKLTVLAASGAVIIGLGLGLAARWLAGRGTRAWRRLAGLVLLILALPTAVLVLGCALSGWHELPSQARQEAQPQTGQAEPGPNLILISIDALRADFLPAYGNRRVRTPNIDRLLHGAAVFEQVRSTSSLTLPGHTAMLTGRHPGELGLLANVGRVPEEVPTLAGSLGQAGLATAGVVSSTVLDPETGIDRGFAWYLTAYPRYRESFHAFLALSLPRLTKEFLGLDIYAAANGRTGRLALDCLQRLEGRRFFLFVHFWGVHDPYRPPLRFYWSPLRSDPWPERLTSRGRYLGELLYVDEQIGRLIDWLEARGLWDRTAVILAADHGEGLGEHGYMYHAREVYEEQLRVPLILRPAAGQGQTRRLEELVSLREVPDLALHLLGFQDWPPAGGELAASHSSGGAKWALSDGRRKVIFNPAAGTWQAFDLQADPEEVNNLASPEPPWPDLVEALKTRLAAFKTPAGEGASPERRKALKALGYL